MLVRISVRLSRGWSCLGTRRSNRRVICPQILVRSGNKTVAKSYSGYSSSQYMRLSSSTVWQDGKGVKGQADARRAKQHANYIVLPGYHATLYQFYQTCKQTTHLCLKGYHSGKALRACFRTDSPTSAPPSTDASPQLLLSTGPARPSSRLRILTVLDLCSSAPTTRPPRHPRVAKFPPKKLTQSRHNLQKKSYTPPPAPSESSSAAYSRSNPHPHTAPRAHGTAPLTSAAYPSTAGITGTASRCRGRGRRSARRRSWGRRRRRRRDSLVRMTRSWGGG